MGTFGQDVLDLFHAVKWVSTALSKKHIHFYTFLQDFRLVFRAKGDCGPQRCKPTPPPETLLANLEFFCKKWEDGEASILTPAVLNEIESPQETHGERMFEWYTPWIWDEQKRKLAPVTEPPPSRASYGNWPSSWLYCYLLPYMECKKEWPWWHSNYSIIHHTCTSNWHNYICTVRRTNPSIWDWGFSWKVFSGTTWDSFCQAVTRHLADNDWNWNDGIRHLHVIRSANWDKSRACQHRWSTRYPVDCFKLSSSPRCS